MSEHLNSDAADLAEAQRLLAGIAARRPVTADDEGPNCPTCGRPKSEDDRAYPRGWTPFVPVLDAAGDQVFDPGDPIVEFVTEALIAPDGTDFGMIEKEVRKLGPDGQPLLGPPKPRMRFVEIPESDVPPCCSTYITFGNSEDKARRQIECYSFAAGHPPPPVEPVVVGNCRFCKRPEAPGAEEIEGHCGRRMTVGNENDRAARAVECAKAAAGGPR